MPVSQYVNTIHGKIYAIIQERLGTSINIVVDPAELDYIASLDGAEQDVAIWKAVLGQKLALGDETGINMLKVYIANMEKELQKSYDSMNLNSFTQKNIQVTLDENLKWGPVGPGQMIPTNDPKTYSDYTDTFDVDLDEYGSSSGLCLHGSIISHTLPSGIIMRKCGTCDMTMPSIFPDKYDINKIKDDADKKKSLQEQIEHQKLLIKTAKKKQNFFNGKKIKEDIEKKEAALKLLEGVHQKLVKVVPIDSYVPKPVVAVAVAAAEPVKPWLEEPKGRRFREEV